MVEIWTNSAGMPSAVARRAERAEASGYDGVTTVDSQNLSGDCYVALALVRPTFRLAPVTATRWAPAVGLSAGVMQGATGISSKVRCPAGEAGRV